MSDLPPPSSTLEQRVQHALDEVRPALQADGGNVSLVKIVDGEVQLRLHGACEGCPMASTTLANFVEQRIRIYAPEITRVVAVSPPP